METYYNLIEVIEFIETFMQDCLNNLGKHKTEVSNDLFLSDARELYVTSLCLMRMMCMKSFFPMMRKVYACIVVMLIVSPFL